jgi:DNA-binding CsgD family transcriptional regulator
MYAAARWLNDLTLDHAEILALIAEGYSQAEIAQQLGRSRHTVHEHIENLRARAGVHTTRELGRLWQQHRGPWMAAVFRRLRMDLAEVEPHLRGTA